MELCGSLLAANHGHLVRDLKKAEDCGIYSFHIDVCDGHYTDCIIFGDQVVSDLRRETSSTLNVHLAVFNMPVILKRFLRSGADSFTIQYESCDFPDRLINAVKKSGKIAGICFIPATGFQEMEYYIDEVDIVNILAVNPGEGGQTFNTEVLRKIELTAEAIQKKGLKTRISVDGGLNLDTIGDAANAGADIAIIGSGIFRGNILENLQKLKEFC